MMDDKIGYIRVSEFDTVTYDQYKEALDDLEKQGMTGLVVDLRNNPGGSLSTVCDMLDLMLPKGLIVYTESVRLSEPRHMERVSYSRFLIWMTEQP